MKLQNKTLDKWASKRPIHVDTNYCARLVNEDFDTGDVVGEISVHGRIMAQFTFSKRERTVKWKSFLFCGNSKISRTIEDTILRYMDILYPKDEKVVAVDEERRPLDYEAVQNAAKLYLASKVGDIFVVGQKIYRLDSIDTDGSAQFSHINLSIAQKDKPFDLWEAMQVFSYAKRVTAEVLFDD